MKKLIIVFFLIGIFVYPTYSQLPDGFNYQGILRNSSGELVKNTPINVKISLLMGSITGELKYCNYSAIL